MPSLGSYLPSLCVRVRVCMFIYIHICISSSSYLSILNPNNSLSHDLFDLSSPYFPCLPYLPVFISLSLPFSPSHRIIPIISTYLYLTSLTLSLLSHSFSHIFFPPLSLSPPPSHMSLTSLISLTLPLLSLPHLSPSPLSLCLPYLSSLIPLPFSNAPHLIRKG